MTKRKTIRPRLERGTPSLEGSCSIQLSYRTMIHGKVQRYPSSCARA